ncbi:hypothetical protein HOY80DRAFT_1112588 [Tuber brumale]|nr:hypothetical protein HOY80DRAFT_1112588 [Tuber brumale]
MSHPPSAFSPEPYQRVVLSRHKRAVTAPIWHVQYRGLGISQIRKRCVRAFTVIHRQAVDYPPAEVLSTPNLWGVLEGIFFLNLLGLNNHFSTRKTCDTVFTSRYWIYGDWKAAEALLLGVSTRLGRLVGGGKATLQTHTQVRAIWLDGLSIKVNQPTPRLEQGVNRIIGGTDTADVWTRLPTTWVSKLKRSSGVATVASLSEDDERIGEGAYAI